MADLIGRSWLLTAFASRDQVARGSDRCPVAVASMPVTRPAKSPAARSGWGEVSAEAKYCQRHDHSAEQGEKDEGLPQRAERLRPEHDATSDLVEVRQRQQISDPPHASSD